MFDKFYLNARKPKGLGGKLILARMNKFEHARLAEWGLDHLAQNYDIAKKRMVMDVGCGGGANIERLLTPVLRQPFSAWITRPSAWKRA